MKLKGKLIMSAAALAACAATLTSTTYAWYTSNTEVSAEKISGNSATSGSDLLLISSTFANNAPTNWNTTVTPTWTGDLNSLAPVTYSDGNLVSLSYDTGALQLVESTNSIAQFDLYFKLSSTTDAKLYVENLTITNDTGENLPIKDILSGNYAALGLSATDTSYSVNMLRALKFDFEFTPYTQSGETVTAGKTIEKVYDPETLFTDAEMKDSLTGKTGYNAHTYMNAVMSKDWTIAETYTDGSIVKNGATGSTGTKDTAWSLGDLLTAGTTATAKQYVKLTVKAYLDGSDLACFDACQGQSFSVSMKFTTAQDKALKIRTKGE